MTTTTPIDADCPVFPPLPAAPPRHRELRDHLAGALAAAEFARAGLTTWSHRGGMIVQTANSVYGLVVHIFADPLADWHDPSHTWHTCLTDTDLQQTVTKIRDLL